ncbi:MAG: cupin domain-containing protein [Gammaproteobacteria bacterium]|nr:cupin domain-containing protein [Gammaproteobacteria bacterium]
MHADNIFESLPADLDQEIFEQIINTKNIKIERILSRGHTSPETGWYDQAQNEWVMVLKGGAIICFENGKEIPLAEGDHINIPAHTKHKVSWTKPDTETIWLAVHY